MTEHNEAVEADHTDDPSNAVTNLSKLFHSLKWPAKTGYYTDILANWPRDLAGPKPPLYLFAAAALLRGAKRPGFEQGFIAMLLREGGATTDEHQAAFNCGPAFVNMRTKYAAAGLITLEKLGSERPQRLKATITERGWQFIKQQIKLNEAEKANTKPVPKAKAPKKAKADHTAAPVQAGQAEIDVEARKAAYANEAVAADHTDQPQA